MINVSEKATKAILPTYNVTVYRGSSSMYLPIENLLNAGVPKSELKDIITVNYLGEKIDCVTVKTFIELLSLTETPLGKTVLNEMVSAGIKESSKNIKNGEVGQIGVEGEEVNIYKDSQGVSYIDISSLGATEEDLIKLRKDADFWKQELLRLEYIDLPEEPEFGCHPLTETKKDPNSGEDLVNLYGFASMVTLGLFQHNTKEGKEILRKALEHANCSEEYNFFLYSIKRGVDQGSVTIAQGLIAEYLQFEFEQQNS